MLPRSFGVLFILVILLAGCSMPRLPNFLPTAEKEAAVDQSAAANGNEENTQSRTLDIGLATPMPSQKDGVVYTVDQYNQNVSSVKSVLNTLIDSLIINDLGKAQTCLIGLDESGSDISLAELQQEMEKLHPVAWQLKDLRPVGSEKALVEVIYTMSDGSVRITEPFSVTNLGDQWTVHFSSFARSFHGAARHMIKDLKKQG